MSDDNEDPKVSRYEWERWIRRCQLSPTVKLVAFVMAQYAARDGSRIYPGVNRLAAVTGLSERSVRSAQAKLRDVGVVERVFEGGRRGSRAFADVYRLSIPADLMDRIPTLDPDESPVPKRQEVPVGNTPSEAPDEVPNRQMTTSQPATGASQPANDDIPTGTTCRPSIHGSPIDQLSDQRGDGVGDVSTEGGRIDLDDLKAKLIQFDAEWAKRRGA